MLSKYSVKANMYKMDMKEINFEDNYFDAVVDIFSSNCLNSEEGFDFIKSVNRVLKQVENFFLIFLINNLQHLQITCPLKKLIKITLDGIKRKDSPFLQFL